MKILVFASDVPATARMAGSPRLFNLCRGLSERHALSLVTLSQSPERYDNFRSDPTTAGVFQSVKLLPSAPDSQTWLETQNHRLRQRPYFSTRFRNPTFHAAQCRRVRDIYVEGGFDAIFVDGVWVAQYVEDADLRVPAIIDLHDSMTLLVHRTRKRERGAWRRFRMLLDERSIGRCEAALCRTFGVVITNSPVDEAFLQRLNPAANTLTIGNGVDSDYFSPADDAIDRAKVVFTGVMNYGPNEDAAIYFGEQVLPHIQKRHPAAEFWVVGKDPGPNVRALEQRAGIHVTGSVPDIRPYVRTAGVFVSPLRNGTGIKNKLLAALAMQKAVVATSPSVEGLDVRDGQDLLVADEPADIAAKVSQLIEDPAYASRLAESGCAFVRAHYSWESSSRMLEETLAKVVHEGVSARPL